MKIGKVEPEVSLYMDMEALSTVYGWTPAQILEQDPQIIECYCAILAGRAKSQKGAVESRKDRREMR
jgi:hypothetical protein